MKLVTARTQWRTRTHDGQKRSIDMRIRVEGGLPCQQDNRPMPQCQWDPGPGSRRIKLSGKLMDKVNEAQRVPLTYYVTVRDSETVTVTVTPAMLVIHIGTLTHYTSGVRKRCICQELHILSSAWRTDVCQFPIYYFGLAKVSMR